MEHALSNLISNAFKYSEGKCPPSIEIDFNEKTVQIVIKDKGIGIPEEELEHLFEPFYRASNVSGVDGSGLGTAIAKDYIELNDGTIIVKSTENVGSEFVVTFNT
jgi:signal transduction histidine kinase